MALREEAVEEMLNELWRKYSDKNRYFTDLPEAIINSKAIRFQKMGVRYMEQLLIVEDDIGLNQGLCKALKADDSADHFLPRPKNGEGTAALRRCVPDPVGYQSAGWQWA